MWEERREGEVRVAKLEKMQEKAIRINKQGVAVDFLQGKMNVLGLSLTGSYFRASQCETFVTKHLINT